MTVSFPVSPVKPLPLPYPANDTPQTLAPWAGVYGASRVVVNGPASVGYLGTGLNGLAAAVHLAYSRHRPLVLSPDDLWLAACQGLGHHIRSNPEAVREKFVLHEGRMVLEVKRAGDFVPDNPANDWAGVLTELAGMIGAAAPGAARYMGAHFTTTGPVEAAARSAVVAAALQDFFDYRLMTLCGIPEIRLLGEPGGWARLRDAVVPWGELGLGGWTAAVAPIYDQFAEAAAGRVDARFWRSMYKVDDTSGGPYINGWFPMVFPVFSGRGGLGLNPFSSWEQIQGHSFTTNGFPPGSAAAPFTWMGVGAPIQMAFHGGFFGVGVDSGDGSVRPVQGWAVARALDETQFKEEQGGWVARSIGAPPKTRDWESPEMKAYGERSRAFLERMRGKFKVNP